MRYADWIKSVLSMTKLKIFILSSLEINTESNISKKRPAALQDIKILRPVASQL
jgi:hypothetical protein